MTTPSPEPAPDAAPLPLAELVGLGLLMLGLAGLDAVAFLAAPLAGAALLSVYLIAAGYALTTKAD